MAILLNGYGVLGLPEVRAFLDYFNLQYDPIAEKDKLAEALEANIPESAVGRVRWELGADHTKWTKQTIKVIMDTARALRMLEPETPIVGDFDVAIPIGGANQAPLVRAELVMDAIRRGNKIPHMILTGSVRRILKDGERENVKNYASNAMTEFDLARGVFDKLAPKSENLTISLCKIDMEKAHNYNVIDYILTEYYDSARLPSTLRICAVTTQIYWLALWLDLQRVAREQGISPENIFAAGTPSAQSIIDGRSPLQYLLEVNRTIRAAIEEAAASQYRK